MSKQRKGGLLDGINLSNYTDARNVETNAAPTGDLLKGINLSNYTDARVSAPVEQPTEEPFKKKVDTGLSGTTSFLGSSFKATPLFDSTNELMRLGRIENALTPEERAQRAEDARQQKLQDDKFENVKRQIIFDGISSAAEKGNLNKAFLSGGVGVLSSAAGLYGLLYNFVNPVGAVAEYVGGKYQESQTGIPPKKNTRDIVLEAADWMSKLSDDLNQKQKKEIGVSEENLNKGPFDLFEEGKIGDGFRVLASEVVKGIPQTIVAAALAPEAAAGFLAQRAGVFAASAGMSMGQYAARDYGMDKDLSAEDIVKGIAKSTIEGLTEAMFMGDINAMKGLGSSLVRGQGTAAKGFLKEIIEKEGKEAAKQEIARGFSKPMAKMLGKGFEGASVLGKVNKGGFEEGIEEVISATGSFIVDRVADGNWSNADYNQLKSDALNSFLIAYGSGGSMNGVNATLSMQRLTDEQKAKVEKFNEVANNETLPTEVRKIAKEKADDIIRFNSDLSYGEYNKLAEVPVEKRVQAFTLLTSINAQEESKKEVKDVDMINAIDESIKDKKAQYEFLLTGKQPISEVYAEEVKEEKLAESEKQASPEQIKTEQQAYQEELAKANEYFKITMGVPNAPMKVSSDFSIKTGIEDLGLNNAYEPSPNMPIEVNKSEDAKRVQFTTKQNPDASLEGDVYTVNQGNNKFATILSTNRNGAQEYYVPELDNAKAFSNLDDAKFAVEEKLTGVPVPEVKRSGIDRLRADKFIPKADVVIKTDDGREVLLDPVAKKSIQNAVTAFKSVSTAPVYLYKNTEDFKRGIALELGKDNKDIDSANEVGGGFFTNKRDEDSIHINLANLNQTTIAHELFHGTVVSVARQNPSAFAEMRDAIINKLGDNDLINVKDNKGNLQKLTAKEYLTLFSNQYSPAQQAEEFLGELTGLLTTDMAKLKDATIWETIKLGLRNLVKTVGIEIPAFEKTANVNETVKFFNDLAKSFKTGKEINISKLNLKDEKQGAAKTESGKQSEARKEEEGIQSSVNQIVEQRRKGNELGKKKRKLSDISAKAMAIEPTTPEDYALQYFINGGQVIRGSKTETQEKDTLFTLFSKARMGGSTEVVSEMRARVRIIGGREAGGLTISNIAEKIFAEYQQATKGDIGIDVDTQYDYMDFKNAVESTLLGYKSDTAMAAALLESKNKPLTQEDSVALTEDEQFDELRIQAEAEAMGMTYDEFKGKLAEFEGNPEIGAIEDAYAQALDMINDEDFANLYELNDNDIAKIDELMAGLDDTTGTLDDKLAEQKKAIRDLEAERKKVVAAMEKAGKETQIDITGKAPIQEQLFGADTKSLTDRLNAVDAQLNTAKADVSATQSAIDFKERGTVDMFERKTEEAPKVNLSNQEPQQAINDVFKANPELSNIGSIEQYTEHLNAIFPDSKVKDIVYHGSKTKKSTEIFVETSIGANNKVLGAGKGFYFTKDINYSKTYGETTFSIINIKNPTDFNSASYDTEQELESAVNKLNEKGDGVIDSRENFYYPKGDEKVKLSLSPDYIVFKPEQIHILGSKEDVEKFKSFVNKEAPSNVLKDQDGKPLVMYVGKKTSIGEGSNYIELSTLEPTKESAFANSIGFNTATVSLENFKRLNYSDILFGNINDEKLNDLLKQAKKSGADGVIAIDGKGNTKAAYVFDQANIQEAKIAEKPQAKAKVAPISSESITQLEQKLYDAELALRTATTEKDKAAAENSVSYLKKAIEDKKASSLIEVDGGQYNNAQIRLAEGKKTTPELQFRLNDVREELIGLNIQIEEKELLFEAFGKSVNTKQDENLVKLVDKRIELKTEEENTAKAIELRKSREKESPAQSKVAEEMKAIQRDIDAYEREIEDATEEIENTKSNYREAVAEIKEKKAALAKEKLSRDEREERKDELDGELEDAADERDGYIEQYKDDIANAKADIKRLNKRLAKLQEANPTVKLQKQGVSVAPTYKYQMNEMFKDPQRLTKDIEAKYDIRSTLKERGKAEGTLIEVERKLTDNIVTNALSKIGVVGFKTIGAIENAPLFKSGTGKTVKLKEALTGWSGYTANSLRNVTLKAIQGNNKYAAAAGRVAASLVGNLAKSNTLQEQRALRSGSQLDANNSIAMLSKSLNGMIGFDDKALMRVHALLDPEAYEILGGENLPTSPSGLSLQELRLYNTLRDMNDFIHEWHYQNEFIDQPTYEKHKGKYFARMYEEIEKKEFADLEEAIDKMPSGLDFRMFKARKDFSEIELTLMNDPIYITSKRLAMMLHNKATLEFANAMAADPSYVTYKNAADIPENNVKGFKLLDSRGGGKRYGDLTNRYVPIALYEELRGTTFANKFVSASYDALRMYDGLYVRQLFKKTKTLYNPTTRLGNITTNFAFAWLAGVDPFTMMKNRVKAKDSLDNYDNYAKELAIAGVLGTDVIVADLSRKKDAEGVLGLLQKVGLNENIANKAKSVDKYLMDSYGRTDDVAKISLYRSLVDDYGKSKEEAIRIVGQSMQNYATVGKAYQYFSKVPLLGNPFVKFSSDMARIVANGFANRPLYMASFLGMMYGTARLLSGLSGEPEEEREARESRAFIPKIPLGFTDIPLTWKVGKYEVNAARFISPYYVYDAGYRSNTIAELTKFAPIQLSYENKVGFASDYMPVMSDPFIAPLAQVVLDKDFRGLPIADPNGSKYTAQTVTPGEALWNRVNYLGHSYASPIWGYTANLYSAATGQGDLYGRRRDIPSAILNSVIKVQEMESKDVQKAVINQVKYIDSEYKQIKTDITSRRNNDIEKIQEVVGSDATESQKEQQILNIQSSYSNFVEERVGRMQELNLERQTPLNRLYKIQNPKKND
jgi:hypothetical protein